MKFLTSLSLLATLAAPTLSATTHKVTVSNANKELIFAPNTTVAAIGDTVEFVFYPMNHSVVQASLTSPCQPLSGNKGFYSGYIPSTSGAASTSFTININDTKPIWFYCSQGDHCQDGMVGAINPPGASGNSSSTSNSSVAAFAAASKKTETTVPDFAPQGGNLTKNAAASGTGTTMSPSSTSTSTASGSAPASTSNAAMAVMAMGSPAAGAFGAVAALFALVL